MDTDEAIKAHLRERSDWGEPWDCWAHVINQMRQGRIYVQVRGERVRGLPKCGFLDSIKIAQMATTKRRRRSSPSV